MSALQNDFFSIIIKMITVGDIVYFLTPGLLGYSVSAICDIGKDAGDSVAFRPPAKFFGIIWAFLFVILGISWMLAAKSSLKKQKNGCSKHVLCVVCYLLFTVSLTIWIIFYGCRNNKKAACWSLTVSIALSIICIIQGTTVSRILISPVIAWCVFALLMNVFEVQNKQTNSK